jgi:hypothetical protein
MSYANPATLRTKFNTEAGREAFDRLNALGSPRWVYFEESDKIYLSPTLEVKEGGCLSSPGNGWGKNVDDVTIQMEKALKERAAEGNYRVVANAYQDNRAEFTYDKAADTFKPFKP